MDGIGALDSLKPELGFQAIVANPPYQKNISGSTEASKKRNASKATPIYQEFVYRAQSLHPAHCSLIMPAKWYTGGWGLGEFRDRMLTDFTLSDLVDFRASEQVFGGTDVNGGIAVLHWDRSKTAPEANIVRFGLKGELLEQDCRPLVLPGGDFLMRDHQAMAILAKTKSLELKPSEVFTDYIIGGFGMNTNFSDFQEAPHFLTSPVGLFYIGERTGWMEAAAVPNQRAALRKWKIFIPLSHSERGNTQVGRCHVFPPHSACTHSYLAAVFESEAEAHAALSYIRTKFFRFLVKQLKISPIATRQVYRLVPKLPLDRIWTEEAVSDYFKLTQEERDYIDATVGPAK